MLWKIEREVSRKIRHYLMGNANKKEQFIVLFLKKFFSTFYYKEVEIFYSVYKKMKKI